MTAAAPAAATTIRGTVVFTDIVGFTEFTALRGDGEALALLTAQEQIVRGVLGGSARIVKDLGDGLMIWFADACAAIEAALCMQERFEETTTQTDAPLSVRIGVHAGQQTRRGEDLVGHDVNIASRIMSLAGAGEVLTSEATVQAIDEMPATLNFERLGPAVMKGIPTPVDLYRAERTFD
jgi:class 3 adenylate cyclase